MCAHPHTEHKHTGPNARAHTHILKTRGPDKELREPVRVSAPIRPKAAVCVCRQAHRFLHFIQRAHTLALPLFFFLFFFHTNILAELPRLADMLFQTSHTKDNGTRLKRQTSPTFPTSHTAGDERRGANTNSKCFQMSRGGDDAKRTRTRISPQTSKQTCRAITENFCIRVFISLSGQSKQ